MKGDGEKISIAGDGKFDSPGEGIIQYCNWFQDMYFRLERQVLHLHSASITYKENYWPLGCYQVDGT